MANCFTENNLDTNKKTNNCDNSKYFINENDMKEFLKKAAIEIHDIVDLEANLKNEFLRKHKLYSVCLFALFIWIFLLIKDCIVLTFFNSYILNEANSKIDNEISWIIPMLIIYSNFAMQCFVLASGIYCQKTLRISNYKIHLVVLICSIFIAMPSILYYKIYTTMMVFLVFCYLFCKRVESAIYSSIVVDTIKRIDYPTIQQNYYDYLKEEIKEQINKSDNEKGPLLGSYGFYSEISHRQTSLSR